MRMIKPMHLSIAVATKGFVRKEQVAACANNSIATFDDATIAFMLLLHHGYHLISFFLSIYNSKFKLP